MSAHNFVFSSYIYICGVVRASFPLYAYEVIVNLCSWRYVNRKAAFNIRKKHIRMYHNVNLNEFTCVKSIYIQ